MELPFNQEAKLRESIEKNDVNQQDMCAILKYSLMDLLPPHLQQSIDPNPELIDFYMAVEKTLQPIPWIDTKNVVFLSISPKVVTSNKTVQKERAKFMKHGFPESEFEEVLKACRTEISTRVSQAKASGKEYTQMEPILFCWVKEEDIPGVLITDIDAQYSKIYSISTDMPFNKDQRTQNTYYKTVVSLLLKELPPFKFYTDRLEFAYFIQGPRLAIFMRIKWI